MKGQLSNLALGVIVAVAVLFIGLYAIAKVAPLVPENELWAYGYSTSTNITTEYVNQSRTDTRRFNLTVADIKNLDDSSRKITIATANFNDSLAMRFNASLNSVFLGYWDVPANTNYTKIYNASNFEDGFNSSAGGLYRLNTIAVTSNSSIKGDAIKQSDVMNVSLYYPSSRVDGNFGSVYSSLITNVGTTYDVMILVIIVVSLGVAIAVLKGFGQEEKQQVSSI